MKKRLLSLLISLSILISLVPALSVSAQDAAPPEELTLMAAEGEFPDTLTLAPSNGSNLPSWIDLTPDPSGAADSYHLYLPGNAELVNCFLTWNGGLDAAYNGKT